MKRTYFIKHDQRIRRIIGCDRATLIFDRLEFYSSRQPDGFYKFIEPNSHKLYKKDESWTELLECHRTSFWRAFKLIGKKHTSRWTFEESEDKFEGKLYASYYDRNTNRMFFIRNHDAVKELFAKIQPGSELVDKEKKSKNNSQSCPEKNSLRTEHNARSYKESKKTSSELFNNNSHAEEIVKKMIEIWTALVEEGRGQIELTSKRIAFLRKAFTDKFDSCLEKWKKFCQDIASSYFLMGEVNDFRADIDWSLKFGNMQKIFEGRYGIGKRSSKHILPSENDLQEEIINSCDPQKVRDFRMLCLKTVGNAQYISYFKNLAIEFRGEGDIALISPNAFSAELLERQCSSYLRLIFNQMEDRANSLTIFAPGESRGRLIEKKREGGKKRNDATDLHTSEDQTLDVLTPDVLTPEKPLAAETLEDTPNLETLEEISSETNLLREKLREFIPAKNFPSWLAKIEVEDINQDGTIVVTLKDSSEGLFMVEWCRSRFSQEILQSATRLWKNVDKVIIRQKLDNCHPSFLERRSEGSENKKKTSLEQAIQSLLAASSSHEPMRVCG